MDELLILTPDVSDAAAILPLAYGSTPWSMGVENLLRMQPSEVCRWTNPALAGCYLDLGSLQPVDTVWLGYHGARPSAPSSAWKVQSADSFDDLIDEAMSFDSGWLPMPSADPDLYDGRTHELFRLPAEVTARFWAIRFDFPSSEDALPSGYFEAGRLVLGRAYRPAAGVEYGAQLGVSEQPQELQSEGGQVYLRGRAKRRWMRLSWAADSEQSAHDDALRLARQRGASREMVVCSKANGSPAAVMARTVYGVADEPLLVSILGYNTFTVDLTVREIP